MSILQNQAGQIHFRTMEEIRAAVRAGRRVYWASTAYIVIEEVINPNSLVRKAQEQFSATSDGLMLCSRHLQNWFGGRVYDSEISQCFMLANESEIDLREENEKRIAKYRNEITAALARYEVAT